MLVAGCMSGTSLDGIDVAIVDLRPSSRGYERALRTFATVPFPARVRAGIAATLPPHSGSTEAVAAAHAMIGDAFGAAIAATAGDARIDFVASHGQTLWHDPARLFTFQAGDAFRIRERVGATVVYDFRAGDTAAGGQGAPLVPYVDALLFAHPLEDRVAVNIGGIANVTILPAGAPAAQTVAFDCGPGNIILDSFIGERTAGHERYDPDGRFAAAGRVDDHALATMRGDPYFAQAPPKSTGREWFGSPFLVRYAEILGRLSLEDGCATLAALTVTTIADAIRDYTHARIILGGGGAHNPSLAGGLRAALPDATIETSEAHGIPVDAKEAVAFAILGYETLRGRPAGMPSVTGAARAGLLGAIAPLRLAALLMRIGEEVAAVA